MQGLEEVIGRQSTSKIREANSQTQPVTHRLETEDI